MNNTKTKIKDFAAIIADGLKIKQRNSEPVEERDLLTELFRASPDRNVSVPLILKTIKELKSATEPAIAAKTELIGDFYQIAIEQTSGDEKNQLISELTFYYLASGLNAEFIHWSDVLLSTIEQNNIEYRATLFAIGAAQIFVNQSGKAKESFNLLLKNFPNAAEAYFGLALTYLKLGDQSHFQNALDFTRRLSPELGRVIDRLSIKGGFSMSDYMNEMSLLDDRNDV